MSSTATGLSRAPAPVIIGAGITGLVRAVALARSGVRPIIVDPYVPGGLVRSVRVDGFTLECGAGTLALTAEMKSLLELLELEKLICFPAIQPYRQYVWQNGAVRRVPQGLASLLSANLLTASEKFLLVRGLQKKLSLQAEDTPSVREMIISLFSAGIADKIVAPVLRGIFGGDARLLIAPLVFPKLFEHLKNGGTVLQYMRAQKASGGRKIFTLQGGNEQLVERCLRFLDGKAELCRGVVTALGYDASKKHFLVTLNSGVALPGSAVHIATSGGSTASYLGKLSPALTMALQRIRYAPIAVIHLALPRSAPLPKEGFGILVPPGGGDSVLGVLFNSQLFPHMAPHDKHLVTVCIGGIGGEGVLKRNSDELEDDARAAIKKYIGFDGAQVLKSTLWAQGIPQYENTLLKVHAEMKALEQSLSGLYFIGADRGGVGVPARVETALRL